MTSVVCCAAFFYPAWWLAMFAVRVLPALAAAGLLGGQLVDLRCGPLNVWAGGDPAPGHGLQAAAIGAAALVSGLALRKHRLLAGLFLACLGHEALIQPLFGWFRPAPLPAWAKVAAGPYFCLLLLGLAWMLSGVAASTYWSRLAVLLGGYLVPLALVLGLMGARSDFRFLSLYLGPSLAASLLVSAPMRVGLHLSSPRWRLAAAGVAASLALAGSTSAADRTMRNAREKQVAAFSAALPRPDPALPYPKQFFQKGVNLTAEGPRGYDPRFSAKMLDELRRRGVDSVALVPYGFFSKEQPRVGFGGGWERAELIEAIASQAHQRGMKVMLKPQLWGRGFVGDLHFDKPEDRAAWFEQYRRFLEYWSGQAAKMHADIFCVGVELRRMTPYEAEWRKLISRARQLYAGPLTYAAIQGEEFETIRFWDALDYIGLNNYYPLPDDLATGAVVRKVEEVQRRFQRPVVFPEAGFCSFKDPHRAPWDETPRALAPAEQARCYEALLRAFYSKPWFHGVYWWKVGTNGRGGPEDGSHTPWGKPAMEVVARWYLQGGR